MMRIEKIYFSYISALPTMQVTSLSGPTVGPGRRLRTMENVVMRTRLVIIGGFAALSAGVLSVLLLRSPERAGAQEKQPTSYATVDVREAFQTTMTRMK